MAGEDSDSVLLARLKVGPDSEASQALWSRYFEQLARLARKRLGDGMRRVADEEDIALSAFDSFFRGVNKGRFPQLDDADDLWQVLVLLTERKAINRRRKETAQKRGGGKVRGDWASLTGDSSDRGEVEQAMTLEPSPEFAAQFAEECARRLACLGDPGLTKVALLRLEGYSNDEIARELKKSVRSVERKLRAIRTLWTDDSTAADQ